jgi:hypothetical protein
MRWDASPRVATRDRKVGASGRGDRSPQETGRAVPGATALLQGGAPPTMRRDAMAILRSAGRAARRAPRAGVMMRRGNVGAG